VLLTQAAGSGTSNTLTVADASYFYDGFGISGEQGDWIRLGGTSQTAQIVSINYSTNTLTLDRPVTFADAQGVSLNYNGMAPDLGIYDYVPEVPAGQQAASRPSATP
jgi:hypothetical protein